MIVRQAGIPLPDGTELAATLYLPGDADTVPVPALLEYLPYRKDDAMLARDHDLYAYMARSGYAGARVDIRGTGRSGGTLPGGEYTETEQRDAEAVIAWLADQPWCTGAVGMWGISWGGFNAIQVALRRPPALKAILAVDASDDLFHDDVHYIDGLPHLDEYALMIDHLNMLPPAPEFPLDDAALARMDTEPWLVSFLAQAQDGPFWRRASLRPDYGRLTVPAYLIGGWYDGYRDSVPRMLAHVPAPVKVLIGPWNHTYPHNAVPGPAIEWRADAVRWWDHWLKGADTGIMAEPPVTVYVRHWHPPDVELTGIPGRWRQENALPPERAEFRTWFCGPEGSLSSEAPAASARSLRYVPSAGIAAGHWWGELTGDQRDADTWSLTFDSGPLEADTEILGFPRVELCGSADAAPLHWFARLSDVAPDGTVTLVTGAGRAGAPDPLRDPLPTAADGREGAADAEAAAGDGGTVPGHGGTVPGHGGTVPGHGGTVPGHGGAAPGDGGTAAGADGGAAAGDGGMAAGALPLELHVTSWVFPRGHRIRLSVSNAMWPMIWPTPSPATAELRLGPAGTRLVLPVIPAAEPAEPEPKFPEPGPEESPDGVRHWGEILPVRWTVHRDELGAVTVSWRGASGSEFPWGRVVDEEYLRYEVDDDRPAQASAHGEARTEVHLDGRLLVTSSTLDLDGDETSLRYRLRRELRSDGLVIRERTWDRRFPRNPW